MVKSWVGEVLEKDVNKKNAWSPPITFYLVVRDKHQTFTDTPGMLFNLFLGLM